MFYVAIYKSKDGRRNLLALCKADGWAAMLKTLGLSQNHKDWTYFTPKEINQLRSGKTSFIEKELSINR